MPAAKLFFLGFPVDDALAEAMAQCDPGDRAFLEDTIYLDSVSMDGVRYLGRRLGEAVSLEQVLDTSRNVASLIQRVVPAWQGGASEAAVLSLEGNMPVPDFSEPE
jgi:hypothetical protein